MLVGAPIVVMRLERTRLYAYRLYERWFDIGKVGPHPSPFSLLWEDTQSGSAQFKVVYVNYASESTRVCGPRHSARRRCMSCVLISCLLFIAHHSRRAHSHVLHRLELRWVTFPDDRS